MSCLRHLPLKLSEFYPIPIVKRQDDARKRFVTLKKPDLIDFHADPEKSDQVESIESVSHGMEDDNLPLIIDAEPTEIAKEILDSRLLPQEFFHRNGNLKDTKLTRQTLFELFKHLESNTENVDIKNNPASALATIIINSISLKAEIDREQWVDPNKIDLEKREITHYVWESLHSGDPNKIWHLEGAKPEELKKTRSEIRKAPLYHLARSIIYTCKQPSSVSRFINFFNNLDLVS